MSENLFADLNLDDPDIPDDPNLIPDNTYPAFVFEVKAHTSQNGDPGVKFVYKISDGTYQGRTIQEWKSLGVKPGTDPEKALKAKAYIKERLTSIGVPVNAAPDDCIGKEVYVTIKNKDGFANVQRVTRNNDEALAGASSDPTDFGL